MIWCVVRFALAATLLVAALLLGRVLLLLVAIAVAFFAVIRWY